MGEGGHAGGGTWLLPLLLLPLLPLLLLLPFLLLLLGTALELLCRRIALLLGTALLLVRRRQRRNCPSSLRQLRLREVLREVHLMREAIMSHQ